MKKNSLFKKAHIPFHICLKLALKNIWKKKFRFLIITIICSISLAFLSFTIELNGDKLRQNVYTMIENGYEYTDIYQYLPLDKEAEKESFYNKYNSVELDLDAYEKIKKDIPEMNIHKYENVKIDYAFKDADIFTSFYPGYIQTIIEFDKTNKYELLAGRLPNEDSKEILITDYLVYAFNYFDVLMQDGTYYDYLNKFIDLNINKGYKIVGVVKTNFDRWVSQTGFKNSKIDESEKQNLSYFNDFVMMNAIIVPSQYYEIEKVDLSGVTTFTKKNANRADWLLTVEKTGLLKNAVPNELSFIDRNLDVTYHVDRWSRQPYGDKPTSSDEIAIPKSWVKLLFGINFNMLSISEFYDLIYQTKLQITITPSHKQNTMTKTFTIVGVTESEDYALINEDTSKFLEDYRQESEKVIVNLPKSANETYILFQKAYKHGYIIDVWKYHTDIDSYVVDPFINIISKAGLIVFVAFTVGIMWTIITIEIVDSKKEIGILRSIGLSGAKVSSIFIIQALLVNLIAYGISIIIAHFVITSYNSGLTDELNLIPLYMYTMTYRTPVFLLGFVLIMTIISTFIPLYRIMSQKIIDVINERE